VTKSGHGIEPEIAALCRQLSGKSLKQLIAERRITRYRLAKDTGISYRTIQYWEDGRMPSPALALKVGQYLGLTKEVDIAELRMQVDELSARIKRLGI